MADPTGTEQPIGYATPPSPPADVGAQLRALQDKIAQAELEAQERDADGDPTRAAMQAQKALPTLYKSLLDWTKVAQTKPANPYANDFRVGNTQYRYDENGIPKEIYTFPAVASQRAPQTAAEAEYDSLRNTYQSLSNQKAQQDLAGQPTPWQQAQQEYRAQQDAITNQHNAQTQALQKMRDTWGAAQDLMGNTLRAAPMAALPGQEYFLGFEPGGAAQANAAGLKIPYDPNQFRAPIIQYDPEEAWRQAQRLIGK